MKDDPVFLIKIVRGSASRRIEIFVTVFGTNKPR